VPPSVISESFSSIAGGPLGTKPTEKTSEDDDDEGDLKKAVPLARHVVALFAGRVEETGEKLFFDRCEGGGETVRLVESTDFGFDAGWFSETGEELIRDEEFKKGGSLGRSCFPACPDQEPISREQSEHGVADPGFCP
jgi:hypothetical protein